jgi:uncharacterized protein YbjT (DUF2867 family)
MKTAIVIGATGLVGKQLTALLLDDERYSKVKIFVRRRSGINNPKLEEHIVDFDRLPTWKDKITGDELFSAMGTTIKKAGSKDVQFKIDFTYQYEIAGDALENGVEKYFLVSSGGANVSSRNFYLKTKGELEEKISLLPFMKIVIFQPSLLVGKREDVRIGEKIGFVFIIFILKIIPYFKKYKPISGYEVAKAMIKSANDESTERIRKYVLNEIFQLTYSE